MILPSCLFLSVICQSGPKCRELRGETFRVIQPIPRGVTGSLTISHRAHGGIHSTSTSNVLSQHHFPSYSWQLLYIMRLPLDRPFARQVEGSPCSSTVIARLAMPIAVDITSSPLLGSTCPSALTSVVGARHNGQSAVGPVSLARKLA